MALFKPCAPSVWLRFLRHLDPRRLQQHQLTQTLSLVDRGFVYAIAHVRGGSEKGWRWYREGKLQRKPNTFGDFIAVAEHLGQDGWCAPDKIVAHGGSAGGTLIGAVANARPNLYAGLIAEVPFVDVLNTMLDETLPLTPPEWPEWGDLYFPILLTPVARFQDHPPCGYFCSYGDNRGNNCEQKYPAILALAGLTDPRVLYWEPAKWIARLRRLRKDRKLIAFRTNLDAGHAGAAGRFDSSQGSSADFRLRDQNRGHRLMTSARCGCAAR